jgi:cob(I)alamin adenosyltransferase
MRRISTLLEHGMRIYTRGGDKGRTSLFSGTRVEKDDPRIEALGSLDELVAVLGLAKALATGQESERPSERAALEAVQTELYLVMADIAADSPGEPRLTADAAARLEREIDAYDAQLPALTEFLIPGATPLSAALHQARAVCRRAERRVRSAGREHALPASVVPYLNRLSDWIFVLSRWVDRAAAEGEATFKDKL